MPKQQPPFGKDTQFKPGKQAAENGRKGGKKSAQVKKERKTVQRILQEILDSDAKDIKVVRSVAAKLGIEDPKSVKDIFTLVCVLNTLKKGDLGDLQQLSVLLGENTETESSEQQKAQEQLLGAIRKAVNGNED